MNPMHATATALRAILLAAVMFILWAGFVGLFVNLLADVGTSPPQGRQNTGSILAAMLVVSLVNASVVSYAIARAAWRGVKLVSAVALQIWGIQFVMSFSEAVYFEGRLGLTGNVALANILGGACMAALFALNAVVVSGRMKSASEPENPAPIPALPWPAFTARFLMLAVILYPLLYFLAGYFIAFQSEAVRLYYTDSPERIPLLAGAGDFWGGGLFLFQIVRGAVWIVISLPAIRMSRAGAGETAVIVGLLFAILMNTQHLLPNPLMPAEIRIVHFVETAPSNFVWGVVVALALRRPLALSRRSRSPHPSRARTP